MQDATTNTPGIAPFTTNGKVNGAIDPTPHWVLREQQRRSAILNGQAPYQPAATAGPHEDPLKHTAAPNSDACSSSIGTAQLYTGPKPRSAPRIRRDPAHWCGWECCYTLPEDEHGLLGKNIDHTPVCHDHCWKIEIVRLLEQQEAQRRRGEEVECFGFPTCHRACYFTALWQTRRPDVNNAEDIEYVPRNRSWAERCRLHKLEHFRSRKPGSRSRHRGPW